MTYIDVEICLAIQKQLFSIFLFRSSAIEIWLFVNEEREKKVSNTLFAGSSFACFAILIGKRDQRNKEQFECSQININLLKVH